MKNIERNKERKRNHESLFDDDFLNNDVFDNVFKNKFLKQLN